LLVILFLALLLHSAFVATYHSLPESLFTMQKERNERVCLLVGLDKTHFSEELNALSIAIQLQVSIDKLYGPNLAKSFILLEWKWRESIQI